MVEITDWSVTMHPIGPRGRLSPGDDRYGCFALWSDPIPFVFSCGEYFLADDGAADDRQALVGSPNNRQLRPVFGQP